MSWEVIALVLLLLFCGYLLWRVLNQPPPQTETAEPPPAVKAAKDLDAFKLLEDSDLDATAFKDTEAGARAKYAGRRLLVALKKGDAVTDEVAATQTATNILTGSTAVTIPATPATTLNGHLKLGDVVGLVSLVAVDEDQNPITPPTKLEEKSVRELVVVGLPGPAQAAKPEGAPTPVVVLAMQGAKAKEFVEVLKGASLTVLRYPPGLGAPEPGGADE